MTLADSRWRLRTAPLGITCVSAASAFAEPQGEAFGNSRTWRHCRLLADGAAGTNVAASIAGEATDDHRNAHLHAEAGQHPDI